MGGRSDGPQAVIAGIVACRTELKTPYAVSCRALGVSQSWFYKHKDWAPTATAARRAALDTAIEAVFRQQDGEYGSPRVHAELLEQPEFSELSVNTVAERMRHQGLRAKAKPVRRSLTRPDPAAPKFANLLQRRFNPPAPNVAWCGDITEIVTWEAKLYLATVIDLWSRRLIGFAIAENCKASLVTDALRMAIATRGGDVAGVVMHTDRGSPIHVTSVRRSLRETLDHPVDVEGRFMPRQRRRRKLVRDAQDRARLPDRADHQSVRSAPDHHLDRPLQPRPPPLTLRVDITTRLRETQHPSG